MHLHFSDPQVNFLISRIHHGFGGFNVSERSLRHDRTATIGIFTIRFGPVFYSWLPSPGRDPRDVTKEVSVSHSRNNNNDTDIPITEVKLPL
jgi:hypothetical protein